MQFRRDDAQISQRECNFRTLFLEEVDSVASSTLIVKLLNMLETLRDLGFIRLFLFTRNEKRYKIIFVCNLIHPFVEKKNIYIYITNIREI